MPTDAEGATDEAHYGGTGCIYCTSSEPETAAERAAWGGDAGRLRRRLAHPAVASVRAGAGRDGGRAGRTVGG